MQEVRSDGYRDVPFGIQARYIRHQQELLIVTKLLSHEVSSY